MATNINIRYMLTTPKSITDLIAGEMVEVDGVVRANLQSDIPLIKEVANYIIRGGGKRLRPALLLLAASCCGYKGTAHFNMAAVIEFIHTATLLHDDVVDNSALRRGRPTTHMIFGNATAVLVGDFLYSRAFQIMAKVNNLEVISTMADATNTIAEGEVLQLINIRNLNISEDEHLTVIRSKTAKLFEAASRIGAILSGAPEKLISAFEGYGRHVGTAFQIVDDFLDYTGDGEKTGKNLGEDLAEGKVTLPLMHIMKYGSKEDIALVKEAISNPDFSDLSAVHRVVSNSGAIGYARGLAESEAAKAVHFLDVVPDSKYKQCLLDLSRFAVNRSY